MRPELLPRYLVVEASGTRDRWVFPKGRIEAGESARAAALREVGEDAGVRVRLIRRPGPVEQKKEGDSIRIVYFLHLGKSRRMLRAAHRAISATAGKRRLAEWLARAARALMRALRGL